MSLIYVEDRGGKTIKLREANGRRYPDWPADSLKHLTEIKGRPDDVILVTYPKSGTHWVSEILRFLVSGTTKIPLSRRLIYFLENSDSDTINRLPVRPPRYLSTHLHEDTLSRDFLRKKSKIIYVTRDPRDVVTSLFHHHKKLTDYFEYDGEWEDHLPLFLEGQLDYDSWFEHIKGWEQCIKDHPDNPFLVLSYEDLKLNPFDNIKNISEFIGMNHSDEFLKEVDVKTSFESMFQIRKFKQADNLVLFRKGEVGDWKNHFTMAQSELFNEIFEKEMVGTNAYRLYSHNVQQKQ